MDISSHQFLESDEYLDNRIVDVEKQLLIAKQKVNRCQVELNKLKQQKLASKGHIKGFREDLELAFGKK